MSEIAVNCAFVVVHHRRRPVAVRLDPVRAHQRGPVVAMTGRLHDSVAWPVHTSRLTLRPATADDAAATWQFRRLPEVSRWLTQNTGTLTKYREQFLDPDSLAKTLVVELEGHVIGDLMLDVQDAWAQTEVADRARGTQGELGWVLHPGHTGRGYATEAVRALLDVAFDEPRAAPGYSRLLRRERGVLATDGAPRHASRDLQRPRVPASLR